MEIFRPNSFVKESGISKEIKENQYPIQITSKLYHEINNSRIITIFKKEANNIRDHLLFKVAIYPLPQPLLIIQKKITCKYPRSP